MLTPRRILDQLNQNGVTHVVYLPDSETNFTYQELAADASLSLVPICREGESIAVAAGLWISGMRPVVLIQNTGLFDAGDSLRGLGLDINFPLVMMIGYRGWTRQGLNTDSAGHYTEPILRAWGIDYYLIAKDDDAWYISKAFGDAERAQRPVACLMGVE